jgi:hypothetical protein
MNLQIGVEIITSYRRLSYTPWHAIAEFVDNSTQSYFDNKELLEKLYEKENEKGLNVHIVYSNSEQSGFLRISDNSIGMSYYELEAAMKIAVPSSKSSGRSRYGMGLKTSACWIGNKWTVRTKKYGETSEHSVTIDVLRISKGNRDINHQEVKNLPIEAHYTIIEIIDHNRKFQ